MMQWLRMEKSLRDILSSVKTGETSAVDALVMIDKTIAAETGRGSTFYAASELSFVGLHILPERFLAIEAECWNIDRRNK